MLFWRNTICQFAQPGGFLFLFKRIQGYKVESKTAKFKKASKIKHLKWFSLWAGTNIRAAKKFYFLSDLLVPAERPENHDFGYPVIKNKIMKDDPFCKGIFCNVYLLVFRQNRPLYFIYNNILSNKFMQLSMN